MKKHLIKATFALALTIALATGCSKKEPAEADHSEMKMPENQETTQTASTPVTQAEQKVAAAPEKPEELKPLSPEMTELLASNKTISVYEQVYYITNSPFNDTEKAQALMMIMTNFNRDGQRTIAHSAVNYVHDSTHALVSTPLLEGKLDKQILSVFMTDTLKRPDQIKMAVLKKLAATEGNPMQAEAQGLLEAFSKSPATSPAQRNEASTHQQMAAKTD
jgi:hypothetical protein